MTTVGSVFSLYSFPTLRRFKSFRLPKIRTEKTKKIIVKNKKNENGKAKDKFEANPTLTSEIVKEDK